MRRSLLGLMLALLSVRAFGAAAAASEASDRSGVLVGVGNDVTLAAGETADVVLVVQADALIEGTADALIALDGTTTISGSGASVEAVVAVGGELTVGPGAVVDDIRYAGTEVSLSPAATVSGGVRDLETDLLWIAGAAGLFFMALWLGAGIATLAAGLAVAGLAGAQARRAAASIGREPFKVLGAGLAAVLATFVAAAFLAVTIIGIPLAMGLFMTLGLVSYLGYLVAGIWIGERLLGSGRTRPPAERPYGAALLGLLILIVAGIVPLVTFLASWFGLGAVTLAGWRVLRSRPAPPAPISPTGMPWPAQPAPPGSGQWPGAGPWQGAGQWSGTGEWPAGPGAPAPYPSPPPGWGPPGGAPPAPSGGG